MIPVQAHIPPTCQNLAADLGHTVDDTRSLPVPASEIAAPAVLETDAAPGYAGAQRDDAVP